MFERLELQGDSLKLSVVIPAHNAGNHIEQTLAAVLALDPPAHEVIIVDDGSDDDTLDVVTRATQASANIHVAQQAQQGVSSARNAGLARVSGDYVLFLDADDLVARELVQHLLSMASFFGDRPDIVCWRFQHVDQDGSPLSTFDGSFSDSIPRSSTGPETLSRILRDRGQAVCTISAAYRTDFLRQHKMVFPEDLAYGEDTEFIWKALSEAKTVAWIDEVLSFYVKRPSSATQFANVARFDSVAARQRIAASLEACPDGTARGLAPLVSDLTTTKFFGVLALFFKRDVQEGMELLNALGERHPLMVRQVRQLVWYQTVRVRGISLARLLFAVSPRLCLSYLRRRYKR